ncbi:MAG TPA: transposase, partial [Coleofasciculaceae cyanobacterium]
YLPPYSPDLNKIERWWSVLKTWIKQRIKEFETVRECVDAAFKKCQTRICVMLYLPYLK